MKNSQLKIKEKQVFFIVRLLLYQKDDLITITKSATTYFLVV